MLQGDFYLINEREKTIDKPVIDNIAIFQTV